eukprot:833211-Heterocapsa_arctica.AAC.1
MEETIILDLVLQRAVAQDCGFCFGSGANTVKRFDTQQKFCVFRVFSDHVHLKVIEGNLRFGKLSPTFSDPRWVILSGSRDASREDADALFLVQHGKRLPCVLNRRKPDRLGETNDL